MTQRKRHRGGRSAFTLVELMVVITIIAILVALLTTAVMKALSKGPELQTSSEIDAMQSKLASVISNPANPLLYLPSRLHLSKTNNYTANPKSPSYNPASPNFPLDRDSMAFLQARFGKHTCFDFHCPPAQIIDWNGDGNGNEELFLEGEQCLVFHLGGVPFQPGGAGTPITMIGFSNNSQNPAAALVVPQPAGGERRQGPYFEFKPDRLVISPAIAGPAFPVYLDPWTHTGGNAKRRPYAFFASYNTEGAGLYDKYVVSDCPSLLTSAGSALTPYVAGATAANPSSFQIISAGQDGIFGDSTKWNNRTGTTDPGGKDDQSNFSAHLLGQGQ